MSEQIRFDPNKAPQLDRSPVRHREFVDDRQAHRVTQRRVACCSEFNVDTVHEYDAINSTTIDSKVVELTVFGEGRAVQRVLKRPHQWLFNGCEIDRTTQDVLKAAGFSRLEIEPVDIGLGGGHVRHFIVGTAQRSESEETT